MLYTYLSELPQVEDVSKRCPFPGGGEGMQRFTIFMYNPRRSDKYYNG
jgi:hypothetical protein